MKVPRILAWGRTPALVLLALSGALVTGCAKGGGDSDTGSEAVATAAQANMNYYAMPG